MPSKDKKNLLLKTGQEVFAARGFSHVGLTELLKIAGIPKGSFYYYFQSKEEYGVEVIHFYIEHYTAYISSLLHDPDLSGKDGLLTYWKEWQESQCKHNCQGYCLIIKLASEVADYSESMRRAFCLGVDRILNLIEAFIVKGQKDHSIGSELAPPILAQQLYQQWLGASLLVKIQKRPTAFHYATRLTNFLLAKDD